MLYFFFYFIYLNEFIAVKIVFILDKAQSL